MNVIHSSDEDKTLKTHFHVRQVVARNEWESVIDITHILRRRMACQLAEAIIERHELFKAETMGALGTVECRMDVIVLTPDELHQIKSDMFKRGFDHGTGMMGRQL